jgi:hypothetical protein
MLAYKAFELDGNTDPHNTPCLISHKNIEEMMLTFKTHRSAMDFDTKFVMECTSEGSGLGKRKR